ncbi:hypothetical protein [Paenibacillus sinopodophylli]|uniref:hypothetical protein n=1 Tax=Paenibacillus sinopodophylli TaxID=1837342 RepID=UPI00110C94F3|nr:hypothetical protein [Paenibacillus sinopodophylli]
MKKRLSYSFVVLTVILIVTGCSGKGPFENVLTDAKEVIVKGEQIDQKLTDADEIARLVDILEESKAIDPPDIAKGIKPEVAKETVMLAFPKAAFFYIGDGYIYEGSNGQYYSVSKNIEKYTIE